MLHVLTCFSGSLSSYFPEALMGLFVIAPEWSQHLSRAYYVPRPVMGHYIPDLIFPPNFSTLLKYNLSP